MVGTEQLHLSTLWHIAVMRSDKSNVTKLLAYVFGTCCKQTQHAMDQTSIYILQVSILSLAVNDSSDYLQPCPPVKSHHWPALAKQLSVGRVTLAAMGDPVIGTFISGELLDVKATGLEGDVSTFIERCVLC